MTLGPHEMQLVVDVPVSGTVSRHDDFDLYRPEGADHPLPAVVLVPGPVPPTLPVRPRQFPIFTGYGQLLAGRGVAAAVADVPFHNPRDWAQASRALSGVIESVRAHDAVDADRIAVWAFSAGALLVDSWFSDSPPWLRCLALSYPMLGPTADKLAPGRPLVLTRVGLESPQLQPVVDRFLSRAADTGTAVTVIDVPNGRHSFDILDPTEESRQAIHQALDLVVTHLTG